MLKKSLKITTGTILVIGGIILTPMPIPLGIISIVIGLSLLVGSVPEIRVWLTQARRRYQEFSNKLNSIKHRLPAIARRLIEDTDPGKG